VSARPRRKSPGGGVAGCRRRHSLTTQQLLFKKRQMGAVQIILKVGRLAGDEKNPNLIPYLESLESIEMSLSYQLKIQSSLQQVRFA
jgi:hypothetical protein